ncbi:MAG TPA: YceI family protein [Candidatus Synoicihabitans sp.]|nr:YceI family protein [Candidatus Synoicihabitans sp.]
MILPKKFLLLLTLAGLAAATVTAAPTTWKADSAHSSVGFKIRHFFSKLPGSFAKVDATVAYDPENVAASSVEATISTASINTGNERRDGHLKNEDFFLVEKYPTITFKSTSWTKTGENTFDITGDLTIKDVTKPVTLKAVHLGTMAGPRGKQVAGWEAKTTLNRHDFGVSFANPALGDEVDVEITIEASPI